MSMDLLDRIEQRTRLAGHNRLALLLFRLGGRQLFGVNVFKVQEVLKRPPLHSLPQARPPLLGLADIRQRSVPVLDLGSAIRHPESLTAESDYLVVTEFNRSVQGFLVSAVERIVNIAVENVKPPPENASGSYLTAVTRYNQDLIQIIDVEKVLAEAIGETRSLSAEMRQKAVIGSEVRVLVVDDSRVAQHQIQSVLELLGATCVVLSDGRQALNYLKDLAKRGEKPSEHFAMVISDIEMPDMDGYTLTTEIRRDPALSDLFVMLHTSLSGIFNTAMVEHVGANAFVPKFSPDDLAEGVLLRFADLGLMDED